LVASKTILYGATYSYTLTVGIQTGIQSQLLLSRRTREPLRIKTKKEPSSRMLDTNNHLKKSVINLLLALIIIGGLGLRTWNVNFDAGTGSHPDERSTVCFYAPSIHLPQSWEEFKDPKLSPANPLWDVNQQSRRSFTYGHFPLYVGIAFGNLLNKLAPAAESLSSTLPISDEVLGMMQRGNEACNGFAVAGRLVIAMFDTLTIFFLFLLGRRLGSRRDPTGKRIGGAMLGILAAAFYAFTAQAIQLSHFFTMDPASTTFTVLAVYGAVRMVQDRTIGAAVLTGVGIGLAVSSKFSALPVLAAPITAGILVFWNNAIVAAQNTNSEYSTTAANGREQFRLMLGVPLAFIIGAIVFAATSPYAVLDWESFVQATLVEQGRMVRGIADFPFTRQYRNTTPYLYFLQQQYSWGLGPILGTITFAGSAVMLMMLVRSMFKLFTGFIGSGSVARPKWLSEMELANVIAWSWVVPYFGLTGAFLAKFNRYMSPVLPFIALFGAALLYNLWGQRRQPLLKTSEKRETEIPAPNVLLDLRRVLAAVIALVGIGGGFFWSAAYVNGVYNTEHPWITASRWIYENAEPGSIILWELWDDALPKPLHDEPGMDMFSTQLTNIDWSPYEEDTPEKFEILKAKLREADYVSYSSKRIYDSVDELPERYPMTNLYYESMWNGDLGYELALDISTPPALLGYTFEDRGADESWSLYDHPQVTIFRKTRDLSDAEFDTLFNRAWEQAQPYYRGADSPISPFLEAVGLGQNQETEKSGLINRLVGLATGDDHSSDDELAERPTLLFDVPVSELPVVDNYRWNEAVSGDTLQSSLWWWLTLTLLGWLAWPICFFIFRPLRDRGYMLSRTFGWLLASWFLWILASGEWAINSVVNSWITVGLLGIIGIGMAIAQWRQIRTFLRRNIGLILFAEVLFGVAYAGFIWVRLQNPDIWQPWFGGEKFMEFAFLNGILRSPYFPPVDPHFAGGHINYYYFGIYMVGYLIKLTGIYAEVAFNLAIATLFALTVSNSFAVAYSAITGADRKRANRKRLTQNRAAALARLENRAARSQETNAQSQLEQSSTLPTVAAPTRAYESLSEIATVTVPIYNPDAATASTDTATQDAGNIDATVSTPEFKYSNVVKLEDYDATRRTQQEASQSRELARQKLSDELPALPWYRGLGLALLAPFFVTLIGNLDGFAQLLRKLQNFSTSEFQSNLPLVESLAHAWSGFIAMRADGSAITNYDFWGPSRVLPATINEFPYWSFLFADLHPHLIGIPLSIMFLALIFVLLKDATVSWRQQKVRGVVLLMIFSLMLGTLASVNLWEFPTYLGLGVLAFIVSRYRRYQRVDLFFTGVVSLLYIGLAYFFFLPFFQNYKNVGASGIGLVREPDATGLWLLIWGFLGFVLLTWAVLTAWQSARRATVNDDDASAADVLATIDSAPSGPERWLSLLLNKFGRLPRFVYLHRLLTTKSTFGYLLTIGLIPLTMLAGVAALLWGRTVLALCLFPLGLVFLLLWRRGRAADSASLFTALLTVTGLAILAGTQVIYLKDFLQGGDWYRMNTLFKFFSQVWVLWAIAAAIAVPRIMQMMNGYTGQESADQNAAEPHLLSRSKRRLSPVWQGVWSVIFAGLLVSSFAYIIFGTPARLDKRFNGWRPEIGTINGMDYMRQGVYTWPDGSNEIELAYDWEAINWLLDNVRGNAVIVESSEVEYYRSGGSRVASLTGLSGLRGMHAQEQRYGEDVGQRSAMHSEFWNTLDPTRTEQLIEDLDIALIYVGQLERFSHPDGVQKLARMAEANQLVVLHSNDRVTIYGVPAHVSTWF